MVNRRIPDELAQIAKEAADLVAGEDEVTPAAGRRFVLLLDDEEAGVVLDALFEHERSASKRHLGAMPRGDTVSTSDKRAAMCLRIAGRLMPQTL